MGVAAGNGRGWVYPRGCGGAHGEKMMVCVEQGLSPRVRGSRLAGHQDSRLEGSIPAGAGEPDKGR